MFSTLLAGSFASALNVDFEAQLLEIIVNQQLTNVLLIVAFEVPA